MIYLFYTLQLWEKLMIKKKFKVESPFEPAGDQGQAIDGLAQGVLDGESRQTLKGVTGSGKTYTMAKIIEKVEKPTIIISHNKTLSAQLYKEFKDFFPNNAVEYFVSYYDYYQPEAYVPSRDLYIDKDASINDEIEQLRLAATTSLMERRDVIIVATVSCIFGLGDPSNFRNMSVELEKGQTLILEDLAKKLIDMQYERNDAEPLPGRFRLRGEVLELFLPNTDRLSYRIETDWDQIKRISRIDPLNGTVVEDLDWLNLYPAKHFVLPEEDLHRAIGSIEDELEEQLSYFESLGKVVEHTRLKSRTEYDLEIMKETGTCPGIENYSRPLTGRAPGERPSCLLDYFPNDDFLLFIDESHVTLPQIGAMYEGDRSRKQNLVQFGFRLPSALDNRPLTGDEFQKVIPQAIYVSATPSKRELDSSTVVKEQIIRPTGLLDPEIDVRPSMGQMEDLYAEITKRTKKKERILITTLTKKMAEDLTDYLLNLGIKTRYLHSEIDTFERIEIIQGLRAGEFDVLVGINLLREGLDIPEVSLTAILDADKIGFLRSETSLIQIIGRTARNVNGLVIMYADRESDAMKVAIKETKRRRKIQNQYNIDHGITPKTIKKELQQVFDRKQKEKEEENRANVEFMKKSTNLLDPKQKKRLIKALENEMLEKAKMLDFEAAAMLRDEIADLKGEK